MKTAFILATLILILSPFTSHSAVPQEFDFSAAEATCHSDVMSDYELYVLVHDASLNPLPVIVDTIKQKNPDITLDDLIEQTRKVLRYIKACQKAALRIP